MPEPEGATLRLHIPEMIRVISPFNQLTGFLVRDCLPAIFTHHSGINKDFVLYYPFNSS